MTQPFNNPASPPLRILMITSEWPTPERPTAAPFVVRGVEFLRRAGHDVEVFHFRGGKRPANYFRAWNQVRFKLKNGQYDLLHAQWGQSGLPALGSGLPLVVTFRGSDLEGIPGADGSYTFAGSVLRLASKIVAYAADEIIAVSERLAQHLPQRSVHVIPSGIDLELFTPIPKQEARQRLGLPEHRHLVLFAANPQDAVKRYPLARAAVDRLAAEHDIEMIVTKGVSHDQMPLYMSACDVLLLTSLHEGSPNVVKEALACNLPVVSTDVGDVRARVGGLAGCAVVGDSPEELAAALLAVLRRNCRIEGRSEVIALDERALTAQVIDVYRQAIGKRRSGSRQRSFGTIES